MLNPPQVDFPKANPGLRGCGHRSPGSLYVECGLSPYGRPFDDFLQDPPLPLLPGLEAATLPNKPHVILDETGTAHLVIWIGAEYYPWLPDYVEEARRHGISRKISQGVLQQRHAPRLGADSRMILIHPRTRNPQWAQQSPPLLCRKDVPGHAPPPPPTVDSWWDRIDPPAMASQRDPATDWFRTSDSPGVPGAPGAREDVGVFPWPEELDEDQPDASARSLATSAATVVGAVSAALPQAERREQCLFKLWELIPETDAAIERDPLSGQPLVDAAQQPVRRTFRLGERLFCTRRIGSTDYQYAPTGEDRSDLEPGIFGVFPLTGFALVARADGRVDDRIERTLATLWRDGDGLPWYRATH